jgi:hypothetical protein
MKLREVQLQEIGLSCFELTATQLSNCGKKTMMRMKTVLWALIICCIGCNNTSNDRQLYAEHRNCESIYISTSGILAKADPQKGSMGYWDGRSVVVEGAVPDRYNAVYTDKSSGRYCPQPEDYGNWEMYRRWHHNENIESVFGQLVNNKQERFVGSIDYYHDEDNNIAYAKITVITVWHNPSLRQTRTTYPLGMTQVGQSRRSHEPRSWYHDYMPRRIRFEYQPELHSDTYIINDIDEIQYRGSGDGVAVHGWPMSVFRP